MKPGIKKLRRNERIALRNRRGDNVVIIRRAIIQAYERGVREGLRQANEIFKKLETELRQ